ncbi:MAG: hypothetical protein HYX66_07000 [Ignavibacteria bacterium]|nr:hypothetical protein [Ignavibacteria bacterium]
MKSHGRSKPNTLITVGVFILVCTVNVYTQTLFDTCGMEGSAVRSDAQILNKKKNRWDVPNTSQINRAVTFARMLASDSIPEGFAEGDAAEIVAYVSDVKLGSKETCNCNNTDSAHRDTHIELTLEPNVNIDKTTLVIAEVTPRFQREKLAEGLDWSTRGLRDAFLGRWVRIRGWVFFDKMHADESAGSNNTRVWRGTAWELHPITSITLTTPDSSSNAPVVSRPEINRPLRQCSAITTKGTRCKRMTSNVSGLCWQHER